MGIVSPIPTYIINTVFFTFLVYQRQTNIINEVFCTFLMYPRDREMTFMT